MRWHSYGVGHAMYDGLPLEVDIHVTFCNALHVLTEYRKNRKGSKLNTFPRKYWMILLIHMGVDNVFSKVDNFLPQTNAHFS